MHNSSAIDRLGIPAYNWWNECLHGVARIPYRTTSFPQAIAMAATWDVSTINKMADYASNEGRAIYKDATKKGKLGSFTGLTFWSPNINIFRDPRWGRGQETYGEDPYLTAKMGASFVKGLQGNDPKYLKVSACAKHYAVHSGPEWNRSTFNAIISDQDLWDTYLPAFKELIVDAKVSGVMCAYNALGGQPCCGNDRLMTDTLRNQWKYTGYVTSDCGGINHFYKTHKTHANKEIASADAVLHGTDCECANDGAYSGLELAVKQGLITESQIDISVRRLFQTRLRLGMFDPIDKVPYTKIPISVLECKKHQDLALKMAQQSIVLLKNENNTLPLSKKLKKIAVVGPNANDEMVLLGNYNGFPSKVVTLLEGIKEKLGKDVQVIYEPGCGLVDTQIFYSQYDSKNLSYENHEGFKAEYFNNTKFNGQPVYENFIKKIDFKWGDGEDVVPGVVSNRISIRYTTDFKAVDTRDYSFKLSGDDKYRLFVNGKIQIQSELGETYFTLKAEKGKTYHLVVEYWQFADNAEVKLDMGVLEKSDPKSVATRVKDANIIIYAGGISPKLEGEEMRVTAEGFRGGDCETIALPKVQTMLLKELKATGKPVVFVLMAGSAIGLEWESKNIPAIVNGWYAGQAGGKAIADVLFGDYNPAGRLPITFYKSEKDLPDYQDYSMSNRTYRYFKGDVVYPFGYGLSYTTFQYSQLKVTSDANNIKVSVTLENTGKRVGEEVVQLYLSSKTNSFRVPIRALKAFNRIALKAGESRAVEFLLTPNELSLVNADGKIVPMKGNITLSVGGSQPNKANLKAKKCVQVSIDNN